MKQEIKLFAGKLDKVEAEINAFIDKLMRDGGKVGSIQMQNDSSQDNYLVIVMVQYLRNKAYGDD